MKNYMCRAGPTIKKPRSFSPANPLIYSFFYYTVGKFIRYAYNIRGENIELLRSVTPPYVVVSHHVNSLDPFFIGYFVRDPLSWIASDSNFRNPLLRFLLHRIRAIPKRKFLSDNDAIRKILNVRGFGGRIGLFPEGQASWDGSTLPILPSTGKLIKLLKIPVITVHLLGSYLVKPRWRKKRRYGAVTVRFSYGMSPEEIKEASPEEINHKLTKILSYNETVTQKERMVPFKGKDKAEYLERFLFMCPQCKSIASLSSKGDVLYCRSCDFFCTYTEYGFLTGAKVSKDFSSPSYWNRWQQEKLKKMILLAGDTARPLFKDNNVFLYRGKGGTAPKKMVHLREMVLSRTSILSIPQNEDLPPISFPMDEIVGINVQNSGRLEFFYKNDLYSFQFMDPAVSSYKWQVGVELLQKNTGEKRVTA